MQHIDTAILVTEALLDLPGPRIVYANEQFIQMSGYSLAELVGQTPRMLQGPRTSRATLDRMRRELATQHHFQGDIINYRKDGGAYCIEWTLSPLQDSVGTITHWIASQRDVTEQRRTEQTLRKREELYRLITEHSQDLICLVDRDGRFLYASPSYQQLLGYDSRALVGTYMFDNAHPEDQGQVLTQWFSIQTSGRGEVTFRYRHAQGIWFWFEAQGTVFEYDGQPCAVIVGHDITKRRWAEQALQESEQRLQMALRDAPIVLFALDKHGRFTPVEGKALQSFHVTSDELIGQSLFERYGSTPTLVEDVQRALAGWAVTTTFVLDSITFEAWLTPIRSRGGSVTGVVVVAIDITMRQRLEADLIRAQRLESVGRLAGGIAHDFNNLLTVIYGATDFILAALPPDSSLQEDATLIQDTAQRAARLTRRLLTFARPQPLEMQVVDVMTIVRDLLPLIRSSVGSTIDVVVHDGSHSGFVLADPGQLEQVIINLVANARDAMPSGGTLQIAATQATIDAGYSQGQTQYEPGAYVRLSVSDTGVGMNPTVQAHLFEPFFTTKEVNKGTGLGLAICYSIVAQHRGHITVQSEEQRGSTFLIDLPRCTDPARLLNVAVQPWEALPCGSETILVVDDEPEILVQVARQLRALGYTVLEASDAEDAEQQIRHHSGQIDLLLTDITLPELPGTILADRIRSIQPSLHNVVFMSGYTTHAVVLHSAPADRHVAFLAKPFTSEVLAHKLRSVLDNK